MSDVIWLAAEKRPEDMTVGELIAEVKARRDGCVCREVAAKLGLSEPGDVLTHIEVLEAGAAAPCASCGEERHDG